MHSSTILNTVGNALRCVSLLLKKKKSLLYVMDGKAEWMPHMSEPVIYKLPEPWE